MDKFRQTIIIIASIILAIALFASGYKLYPRLHPLPVIVNDTIYAIDTVEHTIISQIPYYIIKKDTVIITEIQYEEVDTFAILLDYYSIHKYTRIWEDSIIKVTLKDEIQENAPYKSDFSYKILKPQQTIINQVDYSTTYKNYITLGVYFPIKKMEYSSIELRYINEYWYGGIGYIPDADIKSLSFSMGATIFKFDSKRKTKYY